jgi:ADP-dependent NAD(P)H-hydrate dehydratase / NAD(P)H-hydrate epimerase
VDILTAEQIRAWDQYTIKHEPVSSIDLMERAAGQCSRWISSQKWEDRPFIVSAGKGNNGGDGLAIARQLILSGFEVSVCIVETGRPGTEDFQKNLQRLHDIPVTISYIQNRESFPALQKNAIIIDALFGTGLSKPVEGLYKDLIDYLNQNANLMIAIDLPSGLFPDSSSKGNAVIKATHTLSFQCYKLALLIQENAPYVGEVHILDIGLLKSYLSSIEIRQTLLEERDIAALYKTRNRFANKGNFGHALIMAGGFGKMGAALMACKSCLHGGAGLTTAYIPLCGYVILQSSLPEVMALTDPDEKKLTSLPHSLEKFTVVGVGPGIGTEPATQQFLAHLLSKFRKPMVIDADGLNCIALRKELLKQIPPGSILTPHPKEFDRLFGEHKNDFERDQVARSKSVELNICIVLKSHYTLIATPGGHAFYNSTGNAGMAKGGSGDILTGLLTSLLAQGYDPVSAARFGVYMHGFAGDRAAASSSQEAMVPMEMIVHFGDFFKKLKLKT